MKLSTLLNKLEDVRTEGSSYLARCPAHQDGRPSLLITVTEEHKLLIHCRAGCTKSRVLESLEMRMSDLFDVETDVDDVVMAPSGPPAPPSPEHIESINDYLARANSQFKDSNAARYALDRFGLDPDLGYAIGLGYDEGNLNCEWLSPTYSANSRLVVPFLDTNGIATGFQSRALEADARVRWCGPTNPPQHSWGKVGIFDLFSENDANILVTEGPGDCLTSIAQNTGAILIRGAALANNEETIQQLLAATQQRRVVLAGDNDMSGIDFNITLGSALADQGRQVHTLEITHGGDLTEWRELAGETFPSEFQRGLRQAQRINAGSTPPPPPPEETNFDFDDPLITFKMTDQGNGLRLASQIENNWIFTDSHGWLRYEQGAWLEANGLIKLEAARMLQTTQDVAAGILEACDHLPDEEAELMRELGGRLFRWAHQSENSPRFDRIAERAKDILRIDYEELDQNKHLLVVANGTVDLRSGELLEHSPEHMMTHRIPFNYEPDANAPRWNRFLQEIMCGDEEMVDYLQRLFGYATTGHTKESIVVVFHGGGANGKSVLLNAIRHVLRPICGIAAFSTFEKKTGSSSTADLAHVANARLVFAQEGERNIPMSESLLKRATGGDPVTARHLYQSHFTFEPQWTLFLATNYRPRLSGSDAGLWRRIKLIPFDASFLGAAGDPNLQDTLRDEAEGILTWLVEGSIAWHENRLSDPAKITQEITDYRDTSDELAGFVGTIVVEDSDSIIAGRDLYEAFRDWCMEEGILAWSRRALFAAMKERFPDCRKFKRNDGVHFEGLRLEES
jgi:putative DNA primase/helicase